MTWVKLAIVSCLLAGGYHYWHKQRVEHAPLSANAVYARGQSSPGGFVRTAMPQGAPNNKVLILAPLNCPSAAAKRADALAKALDKMGIPNERGNQFQLHVNNPSPEVQADMKRAGEILGGEIPAVFINGMGKSNPSADEVAAEFRRMR